MQTNCRHLKFSDNEIGKYILQFVLIAVNNWVLKACQCQIMNMSDSLTFCIYFDYVFWLPGQLSTQVQMSGYLSLLRKKPIIELHLLLKGLKIEKIIFSCGLCTYKVFPQIWHLCYLWNQVHVMSSWPVAFISWSNPESSSSEL